MAKSISADATTERRTQKDIVTEILESGVLSPREIVIVAKERHGVEIPKGNVNQIKVQWKKKSGLASKTRTRRSSRAETGTSLKGRGSRGSRGATIDNGRATELEIAKFALRFGGVEQAIEALK